MTPRHAPRAPSTRQTPDSTSPRRAPNRPWSRRRPEGPPPAGRRPRHGRGPGLARRVHVFLARHRRGLAAVLAGLCVLLLAARPQTPAAGSRPVLVAARTLVGGTAVSDSDVRVVQAPAALVADGALSRAGEVKGRVAAMTIPRGAVLTGEALMSTRPEGEGIALVAVRLADPVMASLLTVGQRVTVVTSRSGEAVVLARSAQVRGLPTPSRDSLTSTTSAVVVLGTDERSAAQLALHATDPALGVVVT